MRYDLKLLSGCDAITLLPGWEQSVGARCEVAVALTLGLQFVDSKARPVDKPASVTVTGGYAAVLETEGATL